MFLASDQPRSFRERGVAAPFTTPMLAGARVRAAERRESAELELVIPNPAGGRGAYVVRLGERPEFCRPTLHDMRLGEVLARRPDAAPLSPAVVRRAGWAVAAEGLAGRPAAEAARRAIAADAERLAAAGAFLGPAARDLPGRERLLTALADLHAPAGQAAPLPGLVTALGELAAELAAWAGKCPTRIAPACQAMAAAAHATQAAALRLIGAMQSRLREPASLIAAWRAAAAATEAELTRCGWLLDGWERLVLLWRDGTPGRAAALREMVALLPPWPDEAEAWLGNPGGGWARLAARPVMRGLPPDGPAELLERIARNERLLAMAA